MARQTKSRSQVKLGAVSSSKRGQSGRKSTQSKGALTQLASAKTYRNVWQRLQGSPKLLYVAGGVGAFFLIRFAVRYYKDHPEILEFIKENIDNVEERIGEFRSNFGSESSDVADARH